MNDITSAEFGVIAMSIVSQIVLLLIFVIIIRWALSIQAFMKTAVTQIGLLVLLAKKSGATKEEIDEVLDKMYPKKS
ncbi:MAG: hypothetical protein EOO04_22355 [Chitinophagaceae bacterium]|nr:MAG: hypothetical protein EOO04_22355 [Chitinophagaceae bacterium]